ncbi:MAG: helix-turn-helix domain-containing protein [Alphaproteobacteria bacterium]|nr:helix-turn-helix domain-containing protein [Alphaproteobacteria bacterium]
MSQNQASELKKMFYTVPELYNLLGGIVSKNCIYQMVKRNEIVTKRFGGKIVIPATWVDRFIEEMTSLPDK